MIITDYLTFWSLIISYSVFILILFFKNFVPLWIFLVAGSLLTATSLVGTFCLTIPGLEISQTQTQTQTNSLTRPNLLTILTKDFLIHLGPFLLFLLMFKFLGSRVKTNFKCHKDLFTNFFIATIIVGIIIVLLYISNIDIFRAYKLEQTHQAILLIFLLFSIYITSFILYYNILNSC